MQKFHWNNNNNNKKNPPFRNKVINSQNFRKLGQGLFCFNNGPTILIISYFYGLRSVSSRHRVKYVA